MQKHPFNMACIYMAAATRLNWTESQIMPYIVHSYEKDGVIRNKWFFDSFLIFDFKIRVDGQTYPLSLGSYTNGVQPATKATWQALLDKYFGTTDSDGILKKFNDAIAHAKQSLGHPGFKHRIVLGLPEPLSHYPNPHYDPKDPTSRLHLPVFSSDPNEEGFLWGTDEQNSPIVFRRIQNGNKTDAKNEYSGCSYAVNWFIDECITRWDNEELPNLELSGFYWVNEGGPGVTDAFDTIKNVKLHLESINHSQSLGLQFVFSPYYNFYNGKWTVNGDWTPYREQCPYFDIVFAQPNYSLGAGSIIPDENDENFQAIEASQYTRFMNAITKAANLNDGIDVEMDEHCLYNYDTKSANRQERVYRYLEALRNKFHMDLLYYTGNAFITYVMDANTIYQNIIPTAEDRALIHQLALFIDRRRRQMKAYNDTDINEDGIVDISDMQIVLDEMMGHDTGYGERADVNHDGIIDIVDVNWVSHVMLGYLSEMEDDE